MKVKETINYDSENYGQYAGVEIEVNGKSAFSIRGGEPEDMSLNRDLNDALLVSDLMRKAYDAGKNGEEWTHEIEEIN